MLYSFVWLIVQNLKKNRSEKRKKQGKESPDCTRRAHGSVSVKVEETCRQKQSMEKIQ